MAQVRMRADRSQESGSYPIADPGDYFLRVKEKTDGKTGRDAKNPNCQKVDLIISILDDRNEEVGSVFHTVTFIPEGRKGHGIWLHVNHALGLPYDGEVDFDTDEYLDKECRGRVIVDTYNGKTRNKIEEFYVEDEGEEKKETPPPSRETSRSRQDEQPDPANTDLEEVPF